MRSLITTMCLLFAILPTSTSSEQNAPHLEEIEIEIISHITPSSASGIQQAFDLVSDAYEDRLEYFEIHKAKEYIDVGAFENSILLPISVRVFLPTGEFRVMKN